LTTVLTQVHNPSGRSGSNRQAVQQRPKILLLSAYRSGSHAAWADWLTGSLGTFDWRIHELPGRYFRWRIRGNPISWLDELPPETPDAVIATSMVDLATLRGLHPHLARAPTLYYFHENQFAYPLGEQQASSVDPQMVQLYGALAADRLAFNSAYNRDSFLDGVDGLLRRMPDHVPAGIVERLAARAEVLPVPIHPVPPGPERDRRLILWNHRWEYDKAPERFVDALLELDARGVEFRLALLGARPRQAPEALARLRERLGARIVADGRLSREQYEAVLGRAGIVVSTALHEFQGLAMLEAASAGARPLVPDALSYPEQYPGRYRYRPGDGLALAERLQEWLEVGLPPALNVSAWSVDALGPAWEGAVQDLINDA
jgi:glycosyltransferase involved in cell wall biosynthesis